MDNILIAILLGAVQALTEFLPISSSGHLLLLHEVFRFNTEDDIFFDVALHLGTFFAVLVYFRRDVWKLLRAWLISFRRWHVTSDQDQHLAWLLVIGTIPAAVAGVFLEDIIEYYFRHALVVATMLILVGILFLIFDRKDSGEPKNIEQLSWLNALLIGLAQAVALIPGTSRSGATIITSRALGFSRPEAARFSFLLSLPIIAAAGLKKTFDAVSMGFNTATFLPVLIGFFVSAVFGVVVIKYLMKFLQKYSLAVFAYYRFVLAIVILLMSFYL